MKNIISLVLVFLCGSLCFGEVSGQQKQYRIVSNLFPIVVFADVPEDAVGVARIGEQLLPELMRFFRLEKLPFKKIRISLQKNEKNDLWVVIFRTPQIKKAFYGFPDQDENRTLLLDGYIYVFLFSMMLEEKEKGTEKVMQVPRWLRDGLRTWLFTSRERYYPFLQESLKDGAVIDLDYLLDDADELGLFDSFVAASIIDFIQEHKNGNAFFSVYLADVASGKGQKEALIGLFKETYQDLGTFKEKWKEFVLSRQFFIPGEMSISCAEFLARLKQILYVTVPLHQVPPKKRAKISHSFNDLMILSDAISIRVIINKKLADLMNLKLACQAEYLPCVELYVSSLYCASKEDWGKFRYYFRKAQKALKKIQKDC